MKRKLKLPILLLAVVVMLSIFYIKEAEDNKIRNDVPASGDLDEENLNPVLAELRLEHINEKEDEIKDLETQVSVSLNADEVYVITSKIKEIEDIMNKEMALEEGISRDFLIDEVLVMYDEDQITIHVAGDIKEDIKFFKYIMGYTDGYQKVELIETN